MAKVKKPIIRLPHMLAVGFGVGIGAAATLGFDRNDSSVTVASHLFAMTGVTLVFIIGLLIVTTAVLLLVRAVRHLTDEVFPRFRQVREDVATIGTSMVDPATRERVHRIAEAKRLAAEPDLLLDGPTVATERTRGDAEIDRLVAAEIAKDRQAEIDRLMREQMSKQRARR